MATDIKGQTIASTYQDLVKRDSGTYAQAGMNIEIQNDSGTALATGLYLESGATTDNVGIGIASPTAKLHIEGADPIKVYETGSDYQYQQTGLDLAYLSTNATIDDGFGPSIGFSIKDSGGTLSQIGMIGCVRDTADTKGKLIFGTYDTGGQNFNTTHQRMVIDNTGNVGIGVSDPDTVLEIKGSDSVSAFKVTDSGGGTGANITSHTSQGSYMQIYNASHAVSAVIDGRTDTTSRHTYFNGGGNVGIGTASPGENLTVAGENPGIWIQHDAVNEDASGRLDFTESATAFGTSGGYGFRILNDGDNEPDDDTGLLRIQSGNQTTVSDRLVIERDTGNVGIGLTSPSCPLDIKCADDSDGLKVEHSNGNHLLEVENTSGDAMLTLKNGSAVTGVTLKTGSSGNSYFAGNLGIGTTSPEGKLSLASGMHIIAVDQNIRYADSTDNTVIVQISGYKIPAKAIITRVVAVVTVDSDLATHEVNINLNTSSGIAADAGIASAGSATEILGGGVAATDSSDSTSASDISMGTSAGDEKEVWICNNQIINGASDQYIYVCNAGTGNGTTNSTAGTLSIIIEYYGID